MVGKIRHNILDVEQIDFEALFKLSLDRVSAKASDLLTQMLLDSPCLLVLITGTSQSRQHGKSESDSYYLSDYVVNSFVLDKINIQLYKSDYIELALSYQELFEVGSSRISSSL
ncbi:hypothetical protein Tco_1284936 [Tanacetum coccineum]